MSVRNKPAWLFTSAAGAPGHRFSLTPLIRDWAYPLAIFMLWLVALMFTASQLGTVGPALRSIPEGPTIPHATRSGASARR
jgi:hypothetical protein